MVEGVLVHSERTRRHSVQQPQAGHLIEALPDLGEHGAGSRWHNNMVRQPPVQLLSDLIAQGLAALGVVGAHVDVDESPGVVVGQFAAEAVHLVVGAVHRNQHRVVDGCADDLAPLQV